MLFEADEELHALRVELAQHEQAAMRLREQLHVLVLQKMREQGLIDRRVIDRRRVQRGGRRVTDR